MQAVGADPRGLPRANADVLEVIAEYVCGTVADACALRRAGARWRRAVDTTVRRLVFETQPWLRPAAASASCASSLSDDSRGAILHIHDESDHLDVARIAFTYDDFPRIARLVVLAFALDGPKDEAHEGDVCGPRPVAASDAPPPTAGVNRQLSPLNFLSTWSSPLHRAIDAVPPASHVQALRKCLTSAAMQDEILSNDHECTATAGSVATVGGSRWAGVRYLSLRASNESANVTRHLACMLRCLGPQLTHLQLDTLPTELCPAIATCKKLKHLQGAHWASPGSRDLCDALIATGAPLEYVGVELDSRDAVRLLEAVPTITHALMRKLQMGSLPPAVASRLRSFNDVTSNATLPQLEKLDLGDAHDWTSSVHARRLKVVGNPHGDLASAFPNLREVVVTSAMTATVCFPSSLTDLHIVVPGSALPPLVDALGLHGREGRLPHLATLCITALTPVGMMPLVPFATTLTTLMFRAGDFSDDGETVADMEAALAQLVALVTANVPHLPTARCFLAGRHIRLRDLGLHNADAPTVAPFAKLVAACPRLVRVSSAVRCLGIEAPDGWDVVPHAFGPMIVSRCSFLDI